ncbi:poly(ADP-ribose) glycohydrolase [Leptinotarsa decemlineata]|uniref:poly(ADP-ribose) glycohydrolase n=1 Tax=Leptinotarsa decemlineata TaxID=7539 RepID=UPI003D30D09A
MQCESSEPSKTWLGTGISELCKGKGRWSFSVNPINISKYHAVLFNLPVTLKEPPKPHRSSDPHHWDDDHVHMPYSEKSLFPITENGKDVIKLRWDIIRENLSKPISNTSELDAAIRSYNSSLPKFTALHHFLEEVAEEEESEYFFTNILPKIIKLALKLPELIPGSLPLLKKGHNRSVSLSQLQIASLLANGFLCTFPWRKEVACTYPGVNFVRLFSAHDRPERQTCVDEKLKCIVHYFKRVTSTSPVGVVTFERKFIPKSSMPRWDTLRNNIANSKVYINSSGTIEDDGLGFLQVDFANRNVGGGVLGYGCVQEEIRFIICPELIVSRLFVEQLGDQEAVIVTGVERFSNYSGYGESFQWKGNVIDDTPHDEYGRRRTSICIIDATHFNKPKDQFHPSAMLRELNKAYVGFHSREKVNLAPVATGNWGCGAFRGNSSLKTVLQLMACCAAERDMVYYSFGNEELRDEFYEMYLFLINNNIIISQLWRFLSGFVSTGAPEKNLYPFIQQAYFDSKKQPSIKSFFFPKKEVTVKNVLSSKKFQDKPSTSSSKVKSSKSDSELKMEEGYDSYEDVIPATPPSFKLKKKVKKDPQLTNEEILERLPKANVADLIDEIDGGIINNGKERVNEETLLSSIDKLSRKNKNSKSSEDMDIDLLFSK